MIKFERQYDLFNNNHISLSDKNTFQEIHIDKLVIKEWQKKIIDHQYPMFQMSVYLPDI